MFIRYTSINPNTRPVTISFIGSKYVNSNNTLDTANLQFDVLRYAPIQYWNSQINPVINTNTANVILNSTNIVFTGDADAVANVLSISPLSQQIGWNELLHSFNKTRNVYLFASDWTVSADSPLDANTKQEWVTWRQQVRDLGSQVAANTSPATITFPTPPNGWLNFTNRSIITHPGLLPFRLNPLTAEQLAANTSLPFN